jgi:hypothetical protein
MKKFILIMLLGLIALTSCAWAGGGPRVNVGVYVGFPAPVVYEQVYYPPPPPPVVYYQQPVYYYPQSRPVAFYPYGRYYGGYPRYRDGGPGRYRSYYQSGW